jgi:hypothetical protein
MQRTDHGFHDLGQNKTMQQQVTVPATLNVSKKEILSDLAGNHHTWQPVAEGERATQKRRNLGSVKHKQCRLGKPLPYRLDSRGCFAKLQRFLRGTSEARHKNPGFPSNVSFTEVHKLVHLFTQINNM